MRLITLIIITGLMMSCTSSPKKKTYNKGRLDNSGIIINRVEELSLDQENALDALNAIQVNTDTPNRLYSTFNNIDHPCYPADTGFVITQSELLEVMHEFMTINCQNMSIEDRDELTNLSVKAQDQYDVLQCVELDKNKRNEEGFIMGGKWIFPNVLGRVDVVMVW